MTLLLDEADIRQVLTPELAFDAARDAFLRLGDGTAAMRPRERVAAGGVTLNAMIAVDPVSGYAGAKTYPVVRSDVTRGASFTIQLFDATTGALAAILAGDGIGNARTGAATAVATGVLARPESRTLAVFGAGWVARGQVQAIVRAMDGVDEVLAVGRDPQRARDFCAFVADQTGTSARCTTARDALARADIVVTATGSAEPVFDGALLRPGTHVNAVGSNYAAKRELDDAAVAAADVVVVDDLDTARRESGDLLRAGWREDAVSLGAVMFDRAAGRASPDQITLFSSQGIALLDVVLASRVVDHARARGLGRELGEPFRP